MASFCIVCNRTRDVDNANDPPFHLFPRDVGIRNIWIQNCKLENRFRCRLIDNSMRYAVCSHHFDPTCYVLNTNCLKPNAVPTIFTSMEKICTDIDQIIGEDDPLLVYPEFSNDKSTISITPDVHINRFSILPNTLETHNTPGIRNIPEVLNTPELHNTPSCSRNSLSLIVCTPPDHNESFLKRIGKNKKPRRKRCCKAKKVINNMNTTLDLDLNEEMQIIMPQFDQLCKKIFANKPELYKFVQIQTQLCNTIENERKYKSEEQWFASMTNYYSPKVYKLLQKTFCLPNIRTIQKITKHWSIEAGLSDIVFKKLSLNVPSMTVKEKDCILCVNVMSLKTMLYYNYSTDKIIGFHEENTHKTNEISKSVIVLMIRGLHCSWKQPLVYFFVNSTFTEYSLKSIVFNCILKLRYISFRVRVLITDMGFNFKTFADSLGVTPENPCFKVEKHEVIYMFDPPQLLKSTRNKFFTYRFVSGDQVIDSKYFVQFYNLDVQRTHRLAPKLTKKHINLCPLKKMPVEYALQVFSETVFNAMNTCIADGSLSMEATHTMQFIDSMNNLFDIFNSQTKIKPQETDSVSGDKLLPRNCFCLPFKNVDYQKHCLQSMFNFFKNVKIQSFNNSKDQWIDVKKNSTKFLRSWMITIAGLTRLHDLLSKEYNESVEIITRRLNQDCLKDLFDAICVENDNCTNPTSFQFQRTFKKLFCFHYFKNNKEGSSQYLTIIQDVPESVMYVELDTNSTHYRSVKLPEKNTLQYICGYLLSKCLEVHSCKTCHKYAKKTTKLSSDLFFTYLKSHQHDSISKLSSLITPGSNFYRYILELDSLFVKQFSSFALLPKVGQKLKTLMLNVYFDHFCKEFPKTYLINLFLRLRIYTALTRTNRSLKVPHSKHTHLQILSNL